MNIKGLQELIEMKLPVMRNTLLFRNISRVPKGHMDTYGDDPRWAMRGFDDRVKITDSPYETKEGRKVHGFRRKELKDMFNKLNGEMNDMGFSGDRFYLICEVFLDNDVSFSGFALKDTHNLYHNIYIDIYEKNRLSRKDSNPDISFKIPILGERSSFLSTNSSKYKNYVARICKDLILFWEDSQLDFTCLKDGYFFYHDLFHFKKE